MWHSRPPFSPSIFLSHPKPPRYNSPFLTHYVTYAFNDSPSSGDKLRKSSPSSAANMQLSLWIHWLLLARAGALVTCKDEYESLGNVELDMVFPRNETYPTLQRLPVVFAIRNPALSQNLNIVTTFIVERASSDQSEVVGWGEYDMRSINTTSNDTHFEYPDFLRFYEEGTWMISWNMKWSSCTMKGQFNRHPDEQTTTPNTWQGAPIIFTTRNSTQNLDLVAATSKKNCSGRGKKSGFTIDIIGELNVNETYEGHLSDTCAAVPVKEEILEPCPDYLTDSCQFELDSSTASRISTATAALPCKNKNTTLRELIGQMCEPDVTSAAEKVEIKHAAFITVLFGMISLLLL
jgi:hypothetical protein